MATRVPLLIKVPWAKLSIGRRYDTFVELIDLVRNARNLLPSSECSPRIRTAPCDCSAKETRSTHTNLIFAVVVGGGGGGGGGSSDGQSSNFMIACRLLNNVGRALRASQHATLAELAGLPATAPTALPASVAVKQSRSFAAVFTEPELEFKNARSGDVASSLRSDVDDDVE